ncbi:hypothetical protein BD779DRAFT_1571287 [Infundibulicybe gibba]|nr:hypothetical protein BD779DRAFT_1571287 [Infundibulicybe gibba]
MFLGSLSPLHCHRNMVSPSREGDCPLTPALNGKVPPRPLYGFLQRREFSNRPIYIQRCSG